MNIPIVTGIEINWNSFILEQIFYKKQSITWSSVYEKWGCRLAKEYKNVFCNVYTLQELQ